MKVLLYRWQTTAEVESREVEVEGARVVREGSVTKLIELNAADLLAVVENIEEMKRSKRHPDAIRLVGEGNKVIASIGRFGSLGYRV